LTVFIWFLLASDQRPLVSRGLIFARGARGSDYAAGKENARRLAKHIPDAAQHVSAALQIRDLLKCRAFNDPGSAARRAASGKCRRVGDRLGV
jgi:hypothetical protein